LHQADVRLGYYQVPSAYLGYRPDEAPSIYLHRIDVPRDLLFKKKSTTDPDTPTWDEAMSESPDKVKKWLEAADKEVKALEEKQTWQEVPLSTSTVKVIPGTWVFRCKRAPDGTITKMKARWVLRGTLLDVDFETYAPVVVWPTVWIFLVLSLLLSWTIKALDFANAFVQAKLDHDVFAYLPRGYYSMLNTQEGDRACFKLRKSLYGLTCAPRLWFIHLE
jgi:hypothetical protein